MARSALWPTVLCALSLLVGCPDPTPMPIEGDAAPGTGAGAAGPAGGGAPAAQDPNASQWSVAAGEGVALDGTFAYTGAVSGRLRIDFQRVEGSQPPQLLHTMEIKALGPWSVEAPKGAGAVRVMAFIDTSGDGPTKGDPGAIADITVGDGAVSGITLELKDDFDPSGGAASGGGGGAPAAGAAPAGGGAPAEAPAAGEAAPATPAPAGSP